MIHLPGNESSAITVGAANTYGTNTRTDDTVTTFSSRGPTRSYWTDTTGVKHYDNLIKPEIVAPGNKLIYAESDSNLLVRNNPTLDAGIQNDDNKRMMYLSGTSMATPVVAGAAAMMLQANPKLTPTMVKTILMYRAQPINGANMLEQGAGLLNVEGAVRLGKLFKTTLTATTPVGTASLTGAMPVPVTNYSFNESSTWGQGIIVGQTYATGPNLVTKYQRFYDQGATINDSFVVSNGILLGDTTKLSDGVLLGDGILVSEGILLG